MHFKIRIWAILFFGFFGLIFLSGMFYWNQERSNEVNSIALKAEMRVGFYYQTAAKLSNLKSIAEEFLLSNDLALIDQARVVGAPAHDAEELPVKDVEFINELVNKALTPVGRIDRGAVNFGSV
ncbi:hypothetical protein [uncultured Cohaesibacter sp.]|uniref:hypothetical protein n=1 Tax=uncultured Cohaesibacter sp. TaxID=1002546 RepID=UPI0029305E87|nr:hypothetical protein [uncultured Cohaesibacter sp.]